MNGQTFRQTSGRVGRRRCWSVVGRAGNCRRPASCDVVCAGLDQLCIMNVDATPGRTLNVPVCTLSMPPARAPGMWPGPRINLALPSFRQVQVLHRD